MNILNIRLLGLALALPLTATQVQGAEDLKVTATKKLSEATETFERTFDTSKTLLTINEKQIGLMKESIQRIEERLADVKDDSSVPAARKRIMQKELLSKKRVMIEGILESLNEGEQGVQLAAQKYQGSISGADAAAKYMRGYEASTTALEGTKEEGRGLVKDYQKLQTELENMDRADSSYFSARSELGRKKQAIKNKVNELKRVDQKKAFMRVMADRAEKFKDFVIARQDQMFLATDNYNEAIRSYEHALEMIQLQDDATSMADYPTEMAELNQSLNKLFALSDDLNSQSVDQMMLPLFDEEGNVEFEVNTVDDSDFNEMIKLFYD